MRLIALAILCAAALSACTDTTTPEPPAPTAAQTPLVTNRPAQPDSPPADPARPDLPANEDGPATVDRPPAPEPLTEPPPSKPEEDPDAEFLRRLRAECDRDASLALSSSDPEVTAFVEGLDERLRPAWDELRAAYDKAVVARTAENREMAVKQGDVPEVDNARLLEASRFAMTAGGSSALSVFSMSVTITHENWRDGCRMAGEFLGQMVADAYLYRSGRLWRVMEGID